MNDDMKKLEGELRALQSDYKALVLALKCEPHEDPIIAAKTLVVMAEDREIILEEASRLIDPLDDEQGTLPEILRRIRQDLEIPSDDNNTSFRKAIISIKDERDEALDRCARLADELDELKRQYHDSDAACVIAGRILGHTLLVMQGKTEE